MTVSSTASHVVYLGDGSTTTFPFAFKVNQGDLAVVYSDAGGTDFALSPAQYAATGLGNDDGGSVTYPLSGSPIASGTRLTLYRDVALTQPTALSNQGAMWPQVIERALDRLTFIAQRLSDALGRALAVSPTDETLNLLPNSTGRANAVLAFDGAGQPYAATLDAGVVAWSAWIVDNLRTAASAAAARLALGAAGESNGTWTPTDASGAGLSLTVHSARFAKAGHIAVLSFDVTWPTTADASQAKLGGIPAECAPTDAALGSALGQIGPITGGSGLAGPLCAAIQGSTATVALFHGDGFGSNVTNANLGGARLRGSVAVISGS